MSVNVEQAKTAVDDVRAVIERLNGLPLPYTEREILSVAAGVLTALDAVLAVVAEHEQRLTAAASAAKVADMTAAPEPAVESGVA